LHACTARADISSSSPEVSAGADPEHTPILLDNSSSHIQTPTNESKYDTNHHNPGIRYSLPQVSAGADPQHAPAAHRPPQPVLLDQRSNLTALAHTSTVTQKEARTSTCMFDDLICKV
jgi:hypothetical protein